MVCPVSSFQIGVLSSQSIIEVYEKRVVFSSGDYITFHSHIDE